MDVVFASSRGHDLGPLIRGFVPRPDRLQMNSTSAAKLPELAAQAQSFLAHQTNPECFHIYFMGGYCDMTQKLTGGGYQEIIFPYSTDETIQYLSNIISQISNIITTMGAKPIFCTINE